MSKRIRAERPAELNAFAPSTLGQAYQPELIVRRPRPLPPPPRFVDTEAEDLEDGTVEAPDEDDVDSHPSFIDDDDASTQVKPLGTTKGREYFSLFPFVRDKSYM